MLLVLQLIHPTDSGFLLCFLEEQKGGVPCSFECASVRVIIEQPAMKSLVRIPYLRCRLPVSTVSQYVLLRKTCERRGEH